MSANSHYNFVARLLHWLIAGLIVAQYALAELSEWAEDAGNVVERLALLANHKSIGMTILALAVIRLAWRIFNKPPVLPSSMQPWQKLASHAAHWLIYLLIFCLPLSGWLMSSANAYSVSWFNLFVFPDLVGADKSLASFFHSVHEIMTEVLFVIVIVHIVAALKHHYVDKDGVLGRMASVFGWLVFIATVALVIILFGRLDSPSVNGQTSQDAGKGNLTESAKVGSQDNAKSVSQTSSLSDLPVWDIDYQNSYIKFTGDQAGAPFDGVWKQWKAVMQFDAEQLDKSAFNVTIDTTKVDTEDQERDDYILGEYFFDTTVFKTATFSAKEFQAQPDSQFTSEGVLSIKGLSKPVLFIFNVEQQGDTVELTGLAIIDRLAWNVGTGDWSDIGSVGQQVKVDVKVVATIDRGK